MGSLMQPVRMRLGFMRTKWESGSFLREKA